MDIATKASIIAGVGMLLTFLLGFCAGIAYHMGVELDHLAKRMREIARRPPKN